MDGKTNGWYKLRRGNQKTERKMDENTRKRRRNKGMKNIDKELQEGREEKRSKQLHRQMKQEKNERTEKLRLNDKRREEEKSTDAQVNGSRKYLMDKETNSNNIKWKRRENRRPGQRGGKKRMKEQKWNKDK